LNKQVKAKELSCMSMSVLNNINSMVAQNHLNQTSANLSTVLQQLSSGSRLNSGADDPAGLEIANGLAANITALNQSAQNASDGVGMLQVADGALSQVTTLLNTAVSLATEASNGTVSTAQQASLDTEFTAIKAEITRIGSNTTFNGGKVFSGNTTNVYITDGTTTGSSSIDASVGTLSAASVGFSGTPTDLSSTSLTSVSNAEAALTAITTAIGGIANDRGQLGADINRLQSASNVVNTQVQNVTSAENSFDAANMAQDVTKMTQDNILESTGMAALQQSNQAEQSILKLFQ
jgi:flagellin